MLKENVVVTAIRPRSSQPLAPIAVGSETAAAPSATVLQMILGKLNALEQQVNALTLAQPHAQQPVILNWRYESDQVLNIIAQRAKGTPRAALHNLQACCEVTQSHNRDAITVADVQEAFHYLRIDELGLDERDRNYLKILAKSGPTQLSILSSKLEMPPLTIQRVVEPYLFKEGFVAKGKSALRVLTEKGRSHIQSDCLEANQ